MDIIIEEIANCKDFKKSHIEVETFDNIKDLKYPQEHENNCKIILDDLNKKGINNDKIQAIFKRGRHNIFIFFL